eukprot:355122-Chlamydomonas_euryale.AAC.2
MQGSTSLADLPRAKHIVLLSHGCNLASKAWKRRHCEGGRKRRDSTKGCFDICQDTQDNAVEANLPRELMHGIPEDIVTFPRCWKPAGRDRT